MEQEEQKQDLTTKEIVALMKELNVSYRILKDAHRRGVSQVYYAIHSNDYPGLRKRIIKGLLNRKSKQASL